MKFLHNGLFADSMHPKSENINMKENSLFGTPFSFFEIAVLLDIDSLV